MKTMHKKSGIKWFVVLVLVAAAALVVFLVVSSLNPSEGGIPQTIAVNDAAERFANGTFLLDVREPSEWQEAHVEGAKLIPLGELSTRLAEVPADQDVLIICRSGNRSAQARDLLKQAGYTRVTSISGGITAWMDAGLPVVSGP